MKTLRLIGLLIMAVMVSINLTACGDDDDEENTPITQKYIETLKYTDDDTEYELKASYDDKNRLIKIANDDVDFTINYETSTIVYYRKYDYDYREFSFKMNDKNYVTNITATTGSQYTNEEAQFSYDGNGHLINSVYKYKFNNKDYREMSVHQWKDGNLINIKTGLGDETEQVDFKYGNSINKGNIQPYYGIYDNSLFRIIATEKIGSILVSSGLFGKLSRNLVSSMSMYDDERTYTYELDTNGFVNKATWVDSETFGSNLFTYKE